MISKQVHASTGWIKLEVEVELEVVFSKETNYPSMAKPILLLSGGHFPLRIKSLLFPVRVNYSLIESHFWIQWKPLSLCLKATCTLNGNHFHFGWKLGLLVEASFLFSGKHSAFDLKWLFLDEHHILFESKPVFVSGGHFSFEWKPPLPPVWVDFSLSLSQFSFDWNTLSFYTVSLWAGSGFFWNKNETEIDLICHHAFLFHKQPLTGVIYEAGFDKSLCARTYVRLKLVILEKYFITSTLPYA